MGCKQVKKLDWLKNWKKYKRLKLSDKLGIQHKEKFTNKMG